MDSTRLLTRGSGSKFGGKRVNIDQLASPGTPSKPIGGTQDLPSRKRKRDEDEDVKSRLDTSPEEIRKLHHQHKIKITDLRALHSHDGSESRKAQKQSSRLYTKPLQRFDSLRNQHVNSALLDNMVEQGYKEPTEVQMAAIPLLMQEADMPDLITVSPTGSGKTLAFMIPLINKISHEHKSQAEDTSSRQVSAIVLAPTKELVSQIVNEGRKLAARTGVRVTAFKKGMRLHENVQSAVQSDAEDSESDVPVQGGIVKADVLVSTPLSLLHAITPNHGDIISETPPQPQPLPHITTLILDEADILLDPLFRTQTLSIWSALINPELQTSLWSATIGSNIEEIASSTLNARHNSSTTNRKKASKPPPPLLRIIVGLKDTSLPNITHKLIFSSTEPGKLTALRNLIRPPSGTKTPPLLRPPFLIFTQTIPRAQSLYDELKYDIPPSSLPDAPPRIAVLHSTLSSTQRTKIMTNFRQGKIWILITTDLLSRGIDFRGVNGVVNYDIPTTSASYVHRAGRTGRARREGGVCVTLYTKDDVLYLRPIANVIRKSTKSTTQQANGNGNGNKDVGGIPDWLLDSLPSLTKDAKKELKERGVDVRRAVKESDDSKERRRKGRNVIGTRSGYEKKLENNRRGMIEASKRRKRGDVRGEGNVDGDSDNGSESGEDKFGGFD